MGRYDDTEIDTLIWNAIRDSACPEDFRDCLRHRSEKAAHLDEAIDSVIALDDADATCEASQLCYPVAVSAIEEQANAGNATAKFHMGKLLTQGIGVPLDIERGVAWYRLAILQGEPRSHINLGNLLLEGQASQPDIDEANRHTGYLVGGCSPFGTKKQLPVCMEKTILDLPLIYINGGQRGYLVGVHPHDLLRVLKPKIVECALKD